MRLISKRKLDANDWVSVGYPCPGFAIRASGSASKPGGEVRDRREFIPRGFPRKAYQQTPNRFNDYGKGKLREFGALQIRRTPKSVSAKLQTLA